VVTDAGRGYSLVGLGGLDCNGTDAVRGKFKCGFLSSNLFHVEVEGDDIVARPLSETSSTL
jgi:hypothetical protein